MPIKVECKVKKIRWVCMGIWQRRECLYLGISLWTGRHLYGLIVKEGIWYISNECPGMVGKENGVVIRSLEESKTGRIIASREHVCVVIDRLFCASIWNISADNVFANNWNRFVRNGDRDYSTDSMPCVLLFPICHTGYREVPGFSLVVEDKNTVHTVHGVPKARIQKWFAIPFSSGPRFVRTFHHDTSILGGPTQHGS